MKVGIDPGQNGALAFCYEEKERIKLFDMPTKKVPWKKAVAVSSICIYSILRKHHMPNNAKDRISQINLELVHAGHKQGVVSTFNFGSNFQAVISAVEIFLTIRGNHSIPFNFISPQAWKRQHGLISKSKDTARILALKKFPYLKEPLKRKKDVDRADAILIALYEKGEK